MWHTHIGCFSECLEFLLFERESAEGQRRVLVVFQLGLDLLNLLITLGGETGGERGERRTQDMYCNKGHREMMGIKIRQRRGEIYVTEIGLREKMVVNNSFYVLLRCA